MTSEANAAPRLQVTWHGRTVVGCVRQNNEDSLGAVPLAVPLNDPQVEAGTPDLRTGTAALERPGTLLAVADGMGGAKAGEVASGMAVSIVTQELGSRLGGLPGAASAEDITRTLVAAVEKANERIRDEGASNPNRKGMGTTLTAIWVYDDIAQIAHVGDSRAYLFRKGNLTQLTKDQSLVEKLLEDNIITPEEADRMHAKNIILQALGSEEDLEVASPREQVQPGDTLLLCTDGLTGTMTNVELEEAMRLGGSLEDLCQRLIDLAEKRGGPDNITVLLGRVENEHAAS